MTDTIGIPIAKPKVWEGNVRNICADEAVSELAAFIAAHGLLKSLIVRKVEGGEYAVVDGGLRLRALQRRVYGAAILAKRRSAWQISGSIWISAGVWRISK